MIYSFNNFEIDCEKFTLTKQGTNIEVEPLVFDLIVYLIGNKNKLVTRDELFENLWKGRNVSDSTLSNHIKTARRVLGDDGQSQQVIKTIHGRGYQFIADLKETSIDNDKLIIETKIKYKYFALIVLVILSSLLAFHYFNLGKNQTPKIAILPFTNTKPDPQSDYFSFAVADQIIGDLTYLQNITVRSSAQVRKYINSNMDPISVGKELGVDFILTGNYLKIDRQTRVNMELIEVGTNELIWRSKQIELQDQSAFELQDIVAQRVIDKLKVEFSTSEIQRIKKDIPDSPLAYEYFLRSLAYPYTTEGNNLAIQMLNKSQELDSQYAPTFVQLGDRIRRYRQFSLKTNLFQNLPFQKAEDYYLKALQINPDLLSATSYLAMFYTETNQIDKAIKLAKKMLEINPLHANTHFTLGYIYRYTGMVDAAIDEMEKAVKLDPHNPKYRSLIGTYSGNKNFHKALKMTELYDTNPFTLGWKGLLNRRIGNNEKALEYFDQTIKLDKNGLWANVATVFKSYINGDTKTGLIAVKKLANSAQNDGETLYYLSSYYGLLGDNINCLKYLKEAIEGGFFNYPFMVSNEYFDGIKNESEFKELLKLAQTKHLDFKEMYF